MSRVLVSRYAIEQIKKNSYSFLGSGREGQCHYLGSGEVLKIFYIPKKKNELKIVGCKSDSIAFPVDICYYEDSRQIAGYTMNYLHGDDIYKGIPEKVLIDNLINAYNKIKKEIEKFPNIYMCDLASVNILYDTVNNQINLIDTNGWYRKKQVFKTNINRINAELIKAILRNYNEEEIRNYPQLRNLYRKYKDMLMGFKYLNNIYDEELFLKFLEELIKISRNISGDVNIVGDLGKKILKKS